MDATIMARMNELAQLRRVFNQILASFDELPFSRRKADLEAESTAARFSMQIRCWTSHNVAS